MYLTSCDKFASASHITVRNTYGTRLIGHMTSASLERPRLTMLGTKKSWKIKSDQMSGKTKVCINKLRLTGCLGEEDDLNKDPREGYSLRLDGFLFYSPKCECICNLRQSRAS